ncbi:MAG: translation initiation factor IF-2 [Lachnospiraceae bacterium]|nr:translation initiation factor IF-2 [Lachnospiraceae bacterium]
MAKIRINEITKELVGEGIDVDNKKVIGFLESQGITGKTHSSSVEEEEAEMIRKHFNASKAKAAPKEEEKPKAKAPAKPAAAPAPAKPAAVKPVEEKPVAAKPAGEAQTAAKPAPAKPAGDRPPLKKKKSNIIFSINTGNKGGARQVGQISRGRIDDPGQPGRGLIKPKVKPSPAPEVNIIRPNAQPHAPQKPKADAVSRPAETTPVNPVQTPAPANIRSTDRVSRQSAEKTHINAPNTPYRKEDPGVSRHPGAVPNNRGGFAGPQRPGGKASNQGKGKDFDEQKRRSEGERRRVPDQRRRRDKGILVTDEEKERKRANPHGFKKPAPVAKPVEEEIKVITIPDTLTIKELADHMRMQPSVIIKKLFLTGQIVTVNSEISYEEAENIAIDYDIICEHEKTVDVIAELLKEDEEDEASMDKRPPVVCVMGHVDHGKTSLLDTIRKSHVTEKEAGGITQAIGAYTVSIKGRKITFLDTPGHEAFTAMRMRGANATDIVVLVVAADDGVMPQTVEAINHAKAANVEIVVAINKIDKPSANPDRVKQELSEYELIPEEWGGSTVFVPVSAKAGTGVDDLLEMITLTADVMELKANAHRKARGMVIEAELDKGRGPVATVLVQKGTLHVGDFIACGPCHGKVRAMIDDKGKRVKEAGPSIPVEILGLDDVPQAGEIFVSPDSEKEAQNFANTYKEQHKKELLSETKKKSMTLDDLYSQIQEGDLKEFNVIIKADVQGSVEALKTSLLKLSNDEVAVKVIHGGVGAISESDITLASASNAIIIGFNVRPDSTAKAIAESENVDIHLYKVIYQAIEDVESAMKGMLAPVYEEKIIGHGEIRQVFKASGIGNIAGSYVTDGIVERGCSVKITRGDEELFDGPLSSLKRFKDDVKEVKEGYECGLTFEGFDSVAEGDLLEFHKQVEVERK